MPCADTLSPFPGCRGPDSDAVCNYCWQEEVKKNGGQPKRARPPWPGTTAKATTIPTQPKPVVIQQVQQPPISKPLVTTPTPPITSGVKVLPVLAQARALPLNPQHAQKLVTTPTTAPVSLKSPQQVGCVQQKQPLMPALPPPPQQQTGKVQAPDVTKLPPPPPPLKFKLVRLEVQGACGQSGAWWQTVDSARTIQVKAITEPDSPPVWNKLDWGTNIKTVSRASVGPQTITCSLDSDTQTAKINIYDLTALAVTGGKQTGPDSWKFYESDQDAIVTAATSPDQDAVWRMLDWKPAGPDLKAGRRPNEKMVSLKTAPREVKVSATLGCSASLGQRTLNANIRVCKWPSLEVNKLEFDSRLVVNDGQTQIDKPFDKCWIKGRPDPGPNKVTAAVQSVLRYPMGMAITLEAEFNVTQQPTEQEVVKVLGEAFCGGKSFYWKGNVTVEKNSTKVTLAATASTETLPDEVAKYDPLEIKWYMTEPDLKTLRSIGSTKHLLYVTLADRVDNAAPYWTLLDISCQAAAGKKNENDVVAAAFVPFTKHTGDGKGFRRKGDNVELSYYRYGVKTSAEKPNFSTSPYHTQGILSRVDGTGRCGGWTDLLRHMYKLHGISATKKYILVRPLFWNSAEFKYVCNYDNRFLVKNCTFAGSGALMGRLPYTHEGKIECTKQSGAAGQGKTNPQFDFGDHVFMEHDGKFYDPSYGIGPIVGQFAYEEAALDGVGAYGQQLNFDQSGTAQYIPSSCSPGFAEREITSTTSLDDIATEFNVTPQQLFEHRLNRKLKTQRGNIAGIQERDVIYIPREWSRKRSIPMLHGYYGS